MNRLHLFEGFGVEMELMIVHQEDLSIQPISDLLLKAKHGSIIDELENGKIAWSNELVMHVLELKTNGPADSLYRLDEYFHLNIKEINQLLKPFKAMLMPTAMHPLLKDLKEIKRWPHDRSEIYEQYDRIFDCSGHGWSNLQSTHINLPFYDDQEFAKLHAAIRLVLPLIPALAASSPFMEGRLTGINCNRLEVYKNNQAKIPSIAGNVIPEQINSKKEYEERILNKMYQDIAPYDPVGLLQHEWLNSRGAIARFDRNTIEIRIMDNQECALADLSIVNFIVGVLSALIDEKWVKIAEIQQLETAALVAIYKQSVISAETGMINNRQYLACFGLDEESIQMKDLLNHLLTQIEMNPDYRLSMQHILAAGSLSSRIKAYMNKESSETQIKLLYKQLAICLQENQLFMPE